MRGRAWRAVRRGVAVGAVAAALLVTAPAAPGARAAAAPSPGEVATTRELPRTVDTTPDRARFVTAAAAFLAVGVILAAAWVLTRDPSGGA